ncbi:hypothetical protein TIFTF001_051271 [Ficus carica]|uniref:Uncharacterized protein n=1 Tax=Ficus carica TaxID=3494 RepID=A0AA88CZY9_FICCA|nr:hypothetical protein TIFTF001_051271 [Ficus carica]
MAILPHPLMIIFVTLLSHTALSASAAAATYNVERLGAKADGKTDSTKAFLAAWAKACASPKPVVVYVPQGRFFLKNVVFGGKCNNNDVTFRIAGTLVAPSDYRVIGDAGYWIFFEHTLGFSNSKNIKIMGLTSLNSQMFHIVINGCNNVKLQGVKVSASGTSPNTDGIHVQASTGVTILNSQIGTGDDCVSIGPGTTNLWIEDIACGPGHGIRYLAIARHWESRQGDERGRRAKCDG